MLWRSGYAAVCKTAYTGSIPVGTSRELKLFFKKKSLAKEASSKNELKMNSNSFFDFNFAKAKQENTNLDAFNLGFWILGLRLLRCFFRDFNQRLLSFRKLSCLFD